MAPKYWLAYIGLLISGCSTPGLSAFNANQREWHIERYTTQTTKFASCALLSHEQTFSSDAGTVRINIQIRNDGIVSIVADQNSFDPAVQHEMSLQVDSGAPALAPQLRANHRELTFSASTSARIIDELMGGKTLRAQFALAPRKELLTAVFSLNTFRDALREYRMCEVFRAQQATTAASRQN